jgi:hypothetical protein
LQRAELWAGLSAPLGAGDARDADDRAEGEAAPFAWAHRALCRHGLRLRIGGTPGAERGPREPVWLQLRHQPRRAVEAPMLVIEVLAGVHCVLVETHDRQSVACKQPVVQNLQAHIVLGDGATLQHLRIATPGAADRIAHHLHATLGRDARYAQAMLASGSRYHLQRNVIALQAEGAVARSAGLLLAADAALEHQVRLSHGAARTTSAIEDLALASGSARAVVNAHTRIAPGAAQADVRQRLTGIPTGGQPKLVLRPHLEIHHDQVQATHSATWGALSEEACSMPASAASTNARTRPDRRGHGRRLGAALLQPTTPVAGSAGHRRAAACRGGPPSGTGPGGPTMGDMHDLHSVDHAGLGGAGLEPLARAVSGAGANDQRRAAGLPGQRRHHAVAAAGAGRHAPLRAARPGQHPPRRAHAEPARHRRLRTGPQHPQALCRRGCGHELVFTSGTTDALNLVAHGLSTPGSQPAVIQPGDEIIVSGLEHHANLVPWQQAARRCGAQLRILLPDGRGGCMPRTWRAC